MESAEMAEQIPDVTPQDRVKRVISKAQNAQSQAE
jgi:hypothetical protein